MKHFILYLIFIPLALIFWFFESIGIYAFETIDKKYKYFARGLSIIFGLFLAHLSLRANLESYPFYKVKATVTETIIVKEVVPVNEDECNNNLDIGCTLDFKTHKTIDKNTGEVRYDFDITNYTGGYGTKIGRKDTSATFIDTLSYPFPFIWLNSSESASGIENMIYLPVAYKVKPIQNKLSFSGNIYDFYDQQSRICKFDGLKFGTTSCQASWNKSDSLNIVEIVDSEERVHFRVQQINNDTLIFHGFYKIWDDYLIFGDSISITSDQDEALEKIALIKPMMEHFLPNSHGKMRVK